ncbi:MAG: glycosyltransferase family 39 protein [Nitrospirae bacterium]|nr:glycosyltransferase family 39 protein [Nitrospirota bacterium]
MWAALFLICHPLFIWSARSGRPDALLSFLGLALLGCVAKTRESASERSLKKWAWLAGIMGGLAFLAYPTGISFQAVTTAYLFGASFRKGSP